MSDHPRRRLIAYDVSDDRRRDKVATLLSAHGDRAQFSVCVVDCRPAKLTRIRTQLAKLIKADEDSIHICDIGAPDTAVDVTMQYLGTRRAITADSAIV
jgi:CRISPR-associated protein Cas2